MESLPNGGMTGNTSSDSGTFGNASGPGDIGVDDGTGSKIRSASSGVSTTGLRKPMFTSFC